ncbi:hypothetical protein [Chenggangzhangella methanolivorans]|uniref:Uncharacterized protein n=1 Tax=Chenggangzhangella methanolivorans TaxID=1437009 RepID=A0A9E6ULN1_9HYPH|nr:hypothetical protein [Chenggangzhangella methanolivorans]QZN99145.1 hypothetical protein K6K41_20240 [Chenggangzhangella methanolivorans]
MKSATSDGYDHTISGLLRKRAELFNEAERIRDRMAEIRNDIDALDRTLASFGYKGDLDAAMPRQKRQVMFGTGELTRALMREIADADRPMTSRELAQSVIALRGDDARDRKLLSEVTRRASKALRKQRDDGRVRSAADGNGNLLWSRRVWPGHLPGNSTALDLRKIQTD